MTAIRKLENPTARREIRADFPKMLGMMDMGSITNALDRELKKHSATLDTVGHITIAYPHKHPELFPNHNDLATEDAEYLQERLQKEAPHVQWIMADGICDGVHLGRSENQTSIYTLTQRQKYAVHAASQKTPLPFLNPDNKGKEFFIVVDAAVEQGTTLANMISFIEHNGSSVLIAVYKPDFAFAQTPYKNRIPEVDLPQQFKDAARNTKLLPNMALSFAKSAKKAGHEWTPAQCLESFEAGLARHGNSVFALTNGECWRLIISMDQDDASFPELLNDLSRPSLTDHPSKRGGSGRAGIQTPGK